jgi:anti-sigma28 factor (negative regulator of flagellin synthesis)
MNQEESPEICSEVFFEDRKDKIALLKKSVTDGSYKVKAEDIAAKILKECLWDIVSSLHQPKFQKSRDN